MLYNIEDFNLIEEALKEGILHGDSDQKDIDKIKDEVKRLHELNGTLEAESIMEAIRYRIFVHLNIII